MQKSTKMSTVQPPFPKIKLNRKEWHLRREELVTAVEEIGNYVTLFESCEQLCDNPYRIVNHAQE